MNITGVTPQNSLNYQNTAFKSKIKLVSYADFKTMTDCLNKKKHEVGYPWTPETIKRGKNLFTTKIMDCISGGIVDGRRVTMFHLCTRNQDEAVRTGQTGFDISEIERRLSEKINPESENTHAFIFGGFDFGGKSVCNYKKLCKIKQFFEKQNIPYTVIGGRKEVHRYGRYGLFYNSKEDTWYIATTNTETPAAGYDSPLKRPKEVEIKGRNVYYNTYTKDESTPGNLYDWERKKGSAKSYFEYQFSDVKISDFDKIV